MILIFCFVLSIFLIGADSSSSATGVEMPKSNKDTPMVNLNEAKPLNAQDTPMTDLEVVEDDNYDEEYDEDDDEEFPRVKKYIKYLVGTNLKGEQVEFTKYQDKCVMALQLPESQNLGNLVTRLNALYDAKRTDNDKDLRIVAFENKEEKLSSEELSKVLEEAKFDVYDKKTYEKFSNTFLERRRITLGEEVENVILIEKDSDFVSLYNLTLSTADNNEEKILNEGICDCLDEKLFKEAETNEKRNYYSMVIFKEPRPNDDQMLLLEDYFGEFEPRDPRYKPAFASDPEDDEELDEELDDEILEEEDDEIYDDEELMDEDENFSQEQLESREVNNEDALPLKKRKLETIDENMPHFGNNLEDIKRPRLISAF